MNADNNALETASGMSFEKYKELSLSAAKLFDGMDIGDVIRIFTVLMATHTIKHVTSQDELHEEIAAMAKEIAGVYRDSCLALSEHYTKPQDVTLQ